MGYIVQDANNALKEREEFEQRYELDHDVVANFCKNVNISFAELVASERAARQAREAKKAALSEAEGCSC